MPDDPDSKLKDFFASGFYERSWPDAEDEEGAKAQRAQILALLDARQGHILDWRGGSGRHAIWFARASLTVSLLDFTPGYLQKAGARLLVDCMNLFFLAEPIAKALQEPLPDDGCIRSAQGHFDFATNVWHKSFSLITPDGAELSKAFNQTMYTPEQLVSLLEQAGFAIKGVFGDFAGKPVSFDSPKIVVVATKS